MYINKFIPVYNLYININVLYRKLKLKQNKFLKQC